MSLGSRIGNLVGRTRRARIVTALTIAAIAAAVIAFIALDFDDDSDDSPAETPYQAEADRICLDAKTTLFQVGRQIFAPPQRGDALPRYLEASAQVARQTRSQLADLDPPADLRKRADAFNARLGELAAASDAAGDAIRTVDGARIQATGVQVENATARADQAAVELGLQRCPTIRIQLNPPSG